jgi:hypothetical protein
VGGLSDLAVRTPFSEDELVDFVVENRHMSLAKMTQFLNLTVSEVRRMMGTPEFRRRVSAQLALTVVTLKQEERILERMALDAVDDDVRPADRVRAAEFLLRQSGLERARETKVDVDHSIRVVFEPPTRAAVDWRPPDPMAGVVGAPRLEASIVGALPSSGDGLVANIVETSSGWLDSED